MGASYIANKNIEDGDDGMVPAFTRPRFHIPTSPLQNVNDLMNPDFVNQTRDSHYLYTITAAARSTGCSRTTMHRLLDTGKVGYVRIGTDRRIPRHELTKFIDENTVVAK